MRYAVIVEKDMIDGGYIAKVPSIKGCFTQADTLDELKLRVEEAIAVSLESDGEPTTSLFGILEVEVDSATTASY